jgi:hypothetical protein
LHNNGHVDLNLERFFCHAFWRTTIKQQTRSVIIFSTTRPEATNSKFFHCLPPTEMAPTPKIPRWGKNHNEALHELFAGRHANPERLENDHMDRIWEEAHEGSILRQIPMLRFRHHCREKAAQWLTEQALSGLRRSESLPQICSCSFPVIVSTNMLCCCHFTDEENQETWTVDQVDW